ncbi:xanthine dehydrogenase family protein molybdopterin-binding subunit [Dactylosporangium sp. NPDC005572]|uniref:xanthine dehydrogenase family protein molybdopterin-binding subunit n=1 Tax=Dactylosporangium sp. NPDC005572 TaxID=3156889 RepID=UPI00339EB5CE
MTGIGAAQPRLEDPDLLTGHAKYTADLAHDAAHAVFVRSQHAHGRIVALDTATARSMPDVVAVLTAEDLAAVGPIPFAHAGGEISAEFHRRPLACDVVRFVGDVIAVVVARTRAAALAAAEQVGVDVQPLATAVTIEEALASNALLFPASGTNVAVSSVLNSPGPDRPASAETVSVTTHVVNQRMAVAPMEPSAILAVPHGDELTVWVSTQMPHSLRDLICELLRIPPAKLRVICPAVGGGFGGKTPYDSDYLTIVAVAHHLGVPVRWCQSRAENLTTMLGRDHRFDVTLRARPDGRIEHLAVQAVTNVGAYAGVGVGMIHTARAFATGPYDIAGLRYELRCVTTNTAPTGAVRGAGRPEATHALERAVDELADRLGIDPAELRRRNFIRPEQFPYRNAAGATYDSADFDAALSEAMRLVQYDQLRAEQNSRRSGGDHGLLGIGIACYVEVSANPEGFDREHASVEITEKGDAVVVVGTSAHGQGHHTIYAQIVSTVLGIAPDRVNLVQGDTGQVPRGVGTGGSRSAQIGGSAVHAACTEVLHRARELTAVILGTSVARIAVRSDGLGRADGHGRPVPWSELARHARLGTHGPPAPLRAAPEFVQGGGTSPFGSHIAVVEIDPATGRVTLRHIVAVDDCGVVLNPLLADGQVHGGLALGIGQALFEHSEYDAAGIPTTASLAQYRMPSAADLPRYALGRTVTPTDKNPLGAKGLGEAGSIGALAAVHNAVADALRPLGVRGLHPPFTPERVWQALQATRR